MKTLWFQFLLGAVFSAFASAATYSQPLLLTAKFPTANNYTIAYFDFLSGSAQTIPNNSFLEYDVFIPTDSADFDGGIDMGGSGGSGLTNLRDYTSNGLYIRDQNNLRAHPFSDLSSFAKGQWYHRKFDMGSAGGLSINEACLTTDTGNGGNGAPANLAGYYNGYFDNIRFTNAYGVTLLDLFSNANTLATVGSPASGTFQFGYAAAGASTNNLVTVVQSLALSAAASSVSVTSPMTITATLTGPGGVPVAGANVRVVAARSQDTLSSLTGTTDAAGKLTITVTSSLAGIAQVSAVVGPFSASTSFTFVAGAAVAWRLHVPFYPLFAVGNSGTAMQVGAKGSLGNVTSTTRSVVLSAADAQLQLSSDNVSFFPAASGITLTPSSGLLTFYAQNNAGLGRGVRLYATDSVPAGALAQDYNDIYVNPIPATALSLNLNVNGIAGSTQGLAITAIDASSNPAASVVTVNLSSASATGSFSLDSGYSWAGVTSVALVAGAALVQYRDTTSGSSQVLASSALGSPSATIVLSAGAPSVISGTSSPSAVFNLSSDGPNTSNLTAFVLDAYGNPVSGTSVAFTVVAGGGSLSAATATSNASGAAMVVLTVGTTASASNYVRATVAGIKPTMLNVSASKPTRLNISPNPATGGVGVATSFIVLAQNASNPAITGASMAAVRISSTTASLSFSPNASAWSPTLDLNLVSGQSQFYARSSLATGASGATITATDLSASLQTGRSLLVIFQASLKVKQVMATVYNVTRGENGVSVTMTVQNSGGTNAILDPSIANTYLTFNGLSSNYTISPSPSNPSIVPAGASVNLQFNINVGAAAPLGATVLNGHVSGTDSVTGAVLNDSGATATTGLWQVAGVASQLRIFTPGGTPIAGVPFGVTVVALDASNNTVSTFAQGMTVSTRLVASPGVTATGQLNTSYPVFARGVAFYNSYYTLVQGVYLRADAGGLGANSVGITPVAAGLNEYRIYNPSSAFVGVPFSVTISAMDLYGNTRSGAAAVTLTPSGGSGVLTVTWKNMTAGIVSFANEAYNLAQTIQLFANDGTKTSALAETTPIAVISYTSTVTPSSTITLSSTYSSSPTFTPTPTITLSTTISPSFSVSPTYSQTWTVSPTFSISPTLTVSPSASPTPTFTATPTDPNTLTATGTSSPTPTFSFTATPSSTATPTVSLTWSQSPSFTISPTVTFSPSITLSGTISPTWSVSPTFSASPTTTGTFSASPTFTVSSSATTTPTMTASSTVSTTGSQSPTLTVLPSVTSTPRSTLSGTTSPTWSLSPTFSASPSVTLTISASPSATVSSTVTGSPTMTSTMTPSATITSSSTLTASPTITLTYTVSPTNSVTPTISMTFTGSPTFSYSPTASPTSTAVTHAAVAIPRPNPFWPERGESLYLDIDVAAPGPVKVKAFNLAGELVCVIADKDLGNGRNVISWNGANAAGDWVASGTYFILVEAPGGLQKRFLVGVLK